VNLIVAPFADRQFRLLDATSRVDDQCRQGLTFDVLGRF
jgi:hypothetical protein